MSEPAKNSKAYVLATAAYNEEANIEKPTESVLAQIVLPQRWVIVSNGSLDRTYEIVQRYREKYAFIRSLQVTRLHGRGFRAEVMALQAGIKFLADIPLKFVGNVDIDISIGLSYFGSLI